jgi:hypothetical protein
MGQSERDRQHNEEIMARERQRAADSRARDRQFHDQMSAEISRQERQANAERAKKGGGCLPLLVAGLVGFGTAGYALVELVV